MSEGGSELNRARALRLSGWGKPGRFHRLEDGIGSGIEPRPGGPLTEGLDSGSPSLPSSVSRSRSNTAAIAARPGGPLAQCLAALRLTARGAGWGEVVCYHSATGTPAARADDA